jgi:lysophospholipase L1-like esterase
VCNVENEEDWPVTIRSLALKGTPLATYFGLLNAQWTIDPMRPIAHEVKCQFLGDSIYSYMQLYPEIWNRFAEQDCFNAAFATELSENLLRRMEDRAPFGMPGHRTQGFVDENLPPDTVFLFSIGTNNVISFVMSTEWPPQKTEAEIAIEGGTQIAMGQIAAVARLRAIRPHAQAAILELLPQDRGEVAALMIQEANRLLSEWVPLVQGVEVVKVYDDFVLPDGSRNTALYSDKVHPNAAGYEIIADATQEFLD